jgi:pyridinium-3,5-bisthiocarboxylic acid mononucleotide nickel chelatase
MSPELLAPLVERLLKAGAQDAWFTPIVMKKGRPAFTVSTLVAPNARARVIDVLFEETTTFGVRWSTVRKHMLDRRWVETNVGGHTVRVKVAERRGRVVSLAPEHVDALVAAEALGRPLRLVYSDALRAAEETLASEARS